jgi:hypothetical protein
MVWSPWITWPALVSCLTGNPVRADVAMLIVKIVEKRPGGRQIMERLRRWKLQLIENINFYNVLIDRRKRKKRH